jgi:hypothetical protein
VGCEDLVEFPLPAIFHCRFFHARFEGSLPGGVAAPERGSGVCGAGGPGIDYISFDH